MYRHLSLCLILLLLPLPSISRYHTDELVDLSHLVQMSYHKGPLLTSPINLYLIWYGQWNPSAQSIIRDFLFSFSSPFLPSPSVQDWWRTITYYTDQNNVNITSKLVLASEYFDTSYSQGNSLTRTTVQSVIKAAITSFPNALPLDTQQGVYLILTSPDVQMEEFCRGVCGFHYFTSPSIVGATVPYAWIGHSGIQCPGMCAFPFASPPGNPGFQVLGSPNGDPATEGMVSVIAHELGEMATNPYISGWYAGDDPAAPNEIGDLCEGVYGTGAGSSGFIGNVYRSSDGASYNINGANGRRFMVQWIWDLVRQSCFGPNAVN
ncbi:hypothetical protein LUZ61_009118 [Rhynchospora tenuis]|uniref:Protein EXORDIUM-like 7 n=1 Tax=Rhynchospora tenuis TaxID=198213 RepID=A0AAD5ZWU0_9POAL|nr:hypothetical protein LUZ61_009118 [Rhynchospora tenuis]